MSDPLEIDTTAAFKQLDNLEEAGKLTFSKTIISVRRGYDTLIQFAALTGNAIDQSYQLMAQGLFVAAETLIAIAGAETLTVVGAAKASLSFGLAVALFAKGAQILSEGEQARLQASNIIGLASIWRLY